ncbi:hypothetical protein N0V93_000393 [Gnomoniopsis smithogilvyi]|uniref:Pleckstrin homology domain-containing protein n=1 Tax=Gnomoniopsis smithogilvyi TaxID=1191159 RepID=A0A9W8Z034_9PEZI|nr:hypothetical protein N0V93_000393 [Gnomoniopsis smithogilvyi]
MSRSPPPVPGSDKTDKSDRMPRDLATDEKISILDPRRFTPTLHANLVGEILSLKRDQEEKRKVIEGLEAHLQTTRDEEDDIHATLQTTAKENRSLKRQLALLEGGTSSALAELARERDEAIETAAENKRRLEAAQKKLKLQEESAENTQGSWTKDKNEWEDERRKLDRKIHVLETRLKTVLEEVAASYMAMNDPSSQPIAEEDAEDKGRDSDTGSIRSMSLRYSILQKPNGHSLADELDFDDESDYGTEANGRDSVMSNYRHMRADSRASTIAKFHRRHNSGDSLIRTGSLTRGRFQQMQKDGLLNGIIQETEELTSPAPSKVSYTDTGVQYSPPPSPILSASKGPTPEPKRVTAMAAKWEKQYEEISTEANSRRKRISIAKPLAIQAPTSSQKLMVSTGAQTSTAPISPPRTPRSPEQASIPPKANEAPVLVSIGTQTEIPAAPRPVTPPDTALAIPSIAIIPPNTRPSTPKKPLLPQLQKDFGCQVSIAAVPMTTVGVQTEEIRVDQRLDQLPVHLHPSTITSRPTSPAESAQKPNDPNGHFTPVPGNIPARNPKRLTNSSQRSVSALSASPRGSVDLENGECTMSPVASTRKASTRISNMFTAFHDISSGDEMDDFGDVDPSDSEFRTALSAPRAVKSPEPGRSTPASSPSSPETVVQGRVSTDKTPPSPLGNTNIYNAYKLSGNQGVAMPDRSSSMKSGLQPSSMSSSRVGGMRKAAMIQNGINTHQEDDPPFPIPKRESSRYPISMTGNPNELATPKNHRARGRGHRHQNSGTTANTATTEATLGVQSNGSSQAANGVVDAIAQTMVGEWMFKYVRRRKSFGMGADNSGRDDSSNDRHKRWVWLAPYERAILWSSKQPSSGSALLGAKSGRKLAIQSVLDVKDDNPPPKGQLAVFNRSILILTPQRALKFTAINADRHYLWLTALSFLAHSQQEVPEIPATIAAPKAQPQSQQQQQQEAPDFQPLPPKQSRTRPRIRDSIRLAKSHNPVLSPPRPTGGIGATMSSQHRTLSDRTISPMPSIPDVPTNFLPSSGGMAYRPDSVDRDVVSRDAAEPPVISRFGREQPQQQAPMPSFHGRKRSNTGGRVPPPLSFRGFGAGPGHSVMDSQSTGMSDFGFAGPKTADLTSWRETPSETSSVRTSSQANLFEAIGTMRMEAFISPLAYSRFEGEGGLNYPDVARRRNKEARRQKSRSRSRSRTREGGLARGGVAGWREEYTGYLAAAGRGRRESGYGGRDNGYRTAGEEELRGRRNPFEGF